ncbi:2-amino-4-hydroxy-6-hydroxymethyldihydropteridine diphosphokinase [Peribacillus saganii]|uniref:2-amino-4-hydroxy-6-hydroxymethyldihydropteridine diphosphokinase n=1 Tax=Peribacillus saganii TaxID=2303992 RepID=A0A372LK09_9BACI|nr:2-amino-4-hydroxy-6-hydroxymethyldihydropteridine diphosphokinase [Peribacillus saganii]RFU66895.1 2-amino-4-hydroxy-6-hydroxymethyldihydropteridine diphosphokinase [Peribacillus saganii]
MKNIAYISLGSNIGDRVDFLRRAVSSLESDSEIKVTAISSLYETDPVGYTEQDCFLNAVVEINTSYKPEDLLERCLEIERLLGRKRDLRWGPRTIDLDILLYNQENIESETLFVPHPRLEERAFVIIPLLDLVDPGFVLPMRDQPLIAILDHIQGKEGVRLWKRRNGEDVYALFES